MAVSARAEKKSRVVDRIAVTWWSDEENATDATAGRGPGLECAFASLACVRDLKIDLVPGLHRDHLRDVRALTTGHHRLGVESHLDRPADDALRDPQLRQPGRFCPPQAQALRALVGVDGH